MRTEEISATLGIDVDAATEQKILKRSAEFCAEMADCYPFGGLEADAFNALYHVFCRLIEGTAYGD